MTTKAAAAYYLAQHEASLDGRRVAVHNPHGKDVSELPTIYAFANSNERDWVSAVALAADGAVLGGHLCSHEAYINNDLGVLEGTCKDRHEGQYQRHYPDGYRMEFVQWNDISGHAGLQAAIARAKEGKAT